MSLVRNIARSYRDPGGVVSQLARGDIREPQVLFFGLLACGLIFVAQWPVLSREATLDTSVTFEQRMGGALFAVMFVLPLLLYAIAGLLQFGLRLFSRSVNGLHVRLAFFWTLLSVTPLMMIERGMSAFLGAHPAVTVLGFVVALVFLYKLTAGLGAVLRLSSDRSQQG